MWFQNGTAVPQPSTLSYPTNLIWTSESGLESQRLPPLPFGTITAHHLRMSAVQVPFSQCKKRQRNLAGREETPIF